jgi:hypothetical protein
MKKELLFAFRLATFAAIKPAKNALFGVAMAFFSFFIGHFSKAQTLTTRNYFAAPLDDTTSTREILGRANFAAHNSRGFGSTNDAQGWNATFCSFLEFLRFREGKSAFAFIASSELSANTKNDISFNPRGIVLQESFAYFHKTSHLTWDIGFTHRSRHEIDNDTPPDSDFQNPDYQITSRVVILNGFHAGFLSHPLRWGAKVESRFFGRAEYYLVRSDARQPRISEAQSWKNMRAMSLIGFRTDWEPATWIGTYTRNWVSQAYFQTPLEGDKALKINARAEAGVSILGKKGRCDFFAAYEKYFDDLSLHYPQKSTVLYVGFRGAGGLIW